MILMISGLVTMMLSLFAATPSVMAQVSILNSTRTTSVPTEVLEAAEVGSKAATDGVVLLKHIQSIQDICIDKTNARDHDGIILCSQFMVNEVKTLQKFLADNQNITNKILGIG